jgi:hypothetical protein
MHGHRTTDRVAGTAGRVEEARALLTLLGEQRFGPPTAPARAAVDEATTRRMRILASGGECSSATATATRLAPPAYA